jgi:hypothetical protein
MNHNTKLVRILLLEFRFRLKPLGGTEPRHQPPGENNNNNNNNNNNHEGLEEDREDMFLVDHAMESMETWKFSKCCWIMVLMLDPTSQHRYYFGS